MRLLVGAISGAVFGLGLALGGMLQPVRVVGFLDFFGSWDPTLALVMVGALTVNLPLSQLALRRNKPFWGARFELPTGRQIDRPLVVGSALFGVGWAMAGYCPGPGLTNLATGTANSVWFVFALTAGVFVSKAISSRSGAHPRDSVAASELVTCGEGRVG